MSCCVYDGQGNSQIWGVQYVSRVFTWCSFSEITEVDQLYSKLSVYIKFCIHKRFVYSFVGTFDGVAHSPFLDDRALQPRKEGHGSRLDRCIFKKKVSPRSALGLGDNEEHLHLSSIPVVSGQFSWKTSRVGEKRSFWPCHTGRAPLVFCRAAHFLHYFSVPAQN